jgi:hypothetical protein
MREVLVIYFASPKKSRRLALYPQNSAKSKQGQPGLKEAQDK